MQELRQENLVQHVRRGDYDELEPMPIKVTADRHEFGLLRNGRVFPRELQNTVLRTRVLERKAEKRTWKARRSIVDLIDDCLCVPQ